MSSPSDGAERVISVPDLTEGLRPCLERAVFQAPSPHNTQPWILRWATDDCLVVRLDRARWLRAADPTLRDAWLCIGCAIANARIAAAQFGLGLEWRHNEDEVALELSPTISTEGLEKFAAIWSRQTSRLPYGNVPISDSLTERLIRAALPLRLSVLTGEARTAVHQLLVEATAYQFSHSAIHAELYRWLRFSARERDATRDGLSFDTLNLSPLAAWGARWALHPRVVSLLAHTRALRSLAVSANADARATRQYCLLWSEEPVLEPPALLLAGEKLQTQWLQLTAEGWHVHPASAVLDVSYTALNLKAALSLPYTSSLLALYRVGTSATPARSLRRPPVVDDPLSRAANSVAGDVYG
jgi:hypothetical protein